MIEYSGVQFEAAPGGGLILRLRHQATDNSEIVRIVQLDVNQVQDVIDELGYKFKSPVAEPAEEPPAPVEQEPPAPVEQEPPAPVEQEPPAPVEQEPPATVSDAVAHTVSDIIGN